MFIQAVSLISMACLRFERGGTRSSEIAGPIRRHVRGAIPSERARRELRRRVEFYKKAFGLSVSTEELMRQRGEIAIEFSPSRWTFSFSKARARRSATDELRSRSPPAQ